jgi:hypothetical protein
MRYQSERILIPFLIVVLHEWGTRASVYSFHFLLSLYMNEVPERAYTHSISYCRSTWMRYQSERILIPFLIVALHEWGTRKSLLCSWINNIEVYLTPYLVLKNSQWQDNTHEHHELLIKKEASDAPKGSAWLSWWCIHIDCQKSLFL